MNLRAYFNIFSLALILLCSCSTSTIIKNVEQREKNPLLEKYKQLRQDGWSNYSQKRSRKEKMLSSSPSIKHLSKNPIFQQVTQIHCFKIRATPHRCNSIKYLAMVTCGEIKKEREIKSYLKCLERNFK